jgi:glycosyltransferase involved in cell wall biosynthesis
VRDIPGFARTLANVHADVGLAPLVGDDFDRAKSELHWLEYSCAGVPTVAQRLMRPAPFDVVRDGVDGLVVKSTDEWVRAVRRLVESPALRADLVAAARERIAAEYDYRARAPEWAAAFRAAMESA